MNPTGAHATTGTPATARLGLVVSVLLVLLVLSGLWWSAEDVVQGSTVRIMYVHVPSIWVEIGRAHV